MSKVKYICAECGSEEVRWDAWASWDEYSQQMVLENSFDYTYCENCEGECSVEEVVIEE